MSSQAPGSGDQPVEDTTETLLYDGDCALCANTVKFVLTRERAGNRLRFAPLNGETAARLRELCPPIAESDSIVFVREGPGVCPDAFLYSDAAVRVLRSMGGGWGALGWAIGALPRWMRDPPYRLIARNRYRLFGHDTSCLMGTGIPWRRFDP